MAKGSTTLTWLLTEAIKDPSRGIVTLVGPTGWGKTYHAKAHLQRMGYDPTIVSNPQLDLPEEQGGLPRLRKDGRLQYTQPGIIPPDLVEERANEWAGWGLKTGWALIVDELDKAREDNQSALLSLFEERRIRNTIFPPEIPIVVCMNEPKRTMRPELLSRLMLIPYPLPDMNIVEDRPDLQAFNWLWSGLFDAMPPVQLPERPRAPRAAHRLTPWLRDHAFWRPEHELARTLIVQGLCDKTMAEVVLSRFGQHHVTIDPIEWANTIPSNQFLETVIDVLTKVSPVRVTEAFQIIAKRVVADESKEFYRVYNKFATTPAIFEAIGDPLKRDRAITEIHKWLKTS